MEKIVVCLFALLFMVKAGTVRSFYDEGSKAEYRFHDEPATWLTAYTTCVKEGGRLAVATNKNKEFFKSHFPEDVMRVFLGFNKWETGYYWRTIQDKTLSEAGYEHWNNGEPKDVGGSQQCGAMYKDGTLDDSNCNEKFPFICQINTFSEGYTYYESTKTYYKFHGQPATWLTAYTTCIEESGHLAIINNQEEADFFVRNIPKNSGSSIFLGFNNWERDKSWFTIDGQALSEVGYEKWAPGEPNTAGGIQRCGAMYNSGKFDDDFCNVKRPFICEKKSNSNAAEIKRNYGTVRSFYDEGSKAEYRFHDEPTTWLAAFTTCVKEEGRLAVATNKNKEFFKSHFPEDVMRVFLGFNKWETGYYWRTIQDKTLSEAGYEHWNNGEPKDVGGSQQCGAMYKDGTLDDSNCNEKFPFICQINTFSEGYTYYESTKTYYKFHGQPATWLTAYTTCIEESGHLAIINNQEEADFFVRNIPKNSGSSIFLGFNNWERDKSWFTIDGQALSEVGYEKWAPGEPNTAGGIQRCGAMYNSGKFDDDFCNVKRPFICEKKSNSNAAESEIKRNDDATGFTIEDLAAGTTKDSKDDWLLYQSSGSSIGDETASAGSVAYETDAASDGTDNGYEAGSTPGDDTASAGSVAYETDAASDGTTPGDDTASAGSVAYETDAASDGTTPGDDTASAGSVAYETDAASDGTTPGDDTASAGSVAYETDAASDGTTPGDDTASAGSVAYETDAASDGTTPGDDTASAGSVAYETDAASDGTTPGDDTASAGSVAYETDAASDGTDNWYDWTTPGDDTDVDASRCEDSPYYVLFCKKVVRSKQCHRKNFKKMCCESCTKAAKRI